MMHPDESVVAALAAEPEELDDEPFGELETGGPGEEPLTPELAECLIRDLAALQSHIDTVKANAAALIALDERRIQNLRVIYGPALQAFVAARLTGRRRSWRCLHGVAGFRTVPGRLVVSDDDEALTWATQHCPQAIRPKLDAKAVGTPADFALPDPETGEVFYEPPPGLAVIPAHDVFYVKSGARSNAPGKGDG